VTQGGVVVGDGVKIDGHPGDRCIRPVHRGS
jgi:hypothetical protein